MDYLALARQALASQPFSVLLGAEITAFSPGAAELRIPVGEQMKQQYGFVHGGVVSYASDNALTFAGASALGPTVLTSEFKINYLRPAIGEFLVARATVVYASRNQAVCRCEVFVVAGAGERLCATAQGTIVRMGEPAEEKS